MVERTPAILIFLSSILQIVSILINVCKEIILMIIEIDEAVTQLWQESRILHQSLIPQRPFKHKSFRQHGLWPSLFHITKSNIKIPNRTHFQLSSPLEVHISTEMEHGILILGDLMDDIPIYERVDIHIFLPAESGLNCHNENHLDLIKVRE